MLDSHIIYKQWGMFSVHTNHGNNDTHIHVCVAQQRYAACILEQSVELVVKQL